MLPTPSFLIVEAPLNAGVYDRTHAPLKFARENTEGELPSVPPIHTPPCDPSRASAPRKMLIEFAMDPTPMKKTTSA